MFGPQNRILSGIEERLVQAFDNRAIGRFLRGSITSEEASRLHVVERSSRRKRSPADELLFRELQRVKQEIADSDRRRAESERRRSQVAAAAAGI